VINYLVNRINCDSSRRAFASGVPFKLSNCRLSRERLSKIISPRAIIRECLWVSCAGKGRGQSISERRRWLRRSIRRRRSNLAVNIIFYLKKINLFSSLALKHFILQ